MAIMKPSAFVAIIGDNYVKKEKNYEVCKTVETYQIPMYAVVISGTKWEKFKDFPWRKVIYISSVKELRKSMEDIKKDIEFYYAVGGR